MKVAVLCEFSGVVRDEFLKAGHDAISCDLLPTESPGPHIQGDCRDYDWSEYDLIIAHPPCTYLTNAGVRHLHEHVRSRNSKTAKVYGKERWFAMYKAAEFFNWFKLIKVKRIAIENPIPHKYARNIIGRYDQIVNPWQFGHGECKKTGLWLKNLPLLTPTKIVEGREHRIHKMPPGKDRWKERSRFYPGIAAAMADQWGDPKGFIQKTLDIN